MSSVERDEFIVEEIIYTPWWRNKDIQLAFRLSLSLDIVNIFSIPLDFSRYSYNEG